MAKTLSEVFEKIIKVVEKTEWKKFKTKAKAVGPIMKKDIVTTIQAGISPVKGQGRFVKYSESYEDAIRKGRFAGKSIRPVNMTVTGKMLKMFAVKISNSGFSLFFTSKLVKIHSFLGAGKSKTIRQLVPGPNQDFKASVLNNGRKKLIKLIEQYLRINFRRIK